MIKKIPPSNGTHGLTPESTITTSAPISKSRCHHLSPAFFEIASGWSCTNNLGFPRDSHRGPIGKRGLSVAKLAGWAMHTISNAGLTNAEMVQKTSSTEMAKGSPCHCRMQKCGNLNNNCLIGCFINWVTSIPWCHSTFMFVETCSKSTSFFRPNLRQIGRCYSRGQAPSHPLRVAAGSIPDHRKKWLRERQLFLSPEVNNV
jgi:hypothetical protein